MEIRCVSYIRVSTKSQGDSGLGLEAQRRSVSHYVAWVKGVLLKEFVEVESGKGRRVILDEAISYCRDERCILVVAKLDRLYRNVYFTAQLMNSNVHFVCCDMPFADRLTIHIFAAIAEWEAQRISQRTKDALSVLKKNGRPLGNPRLALAHEATRGIPHKRNFDAASLNENNKKAYTLIVAMKQSGKSLSEIAGKLNEGGYKTRTGKMFTANNVNMLYRRGKKYFL